MKRYLIAAATIVAAALLVGLGGAKTDASARGFTAGSLGIEAVARTTPLPRPTVAPERSIDNPSARRQIISKATPRQAASTQARTDVRFVQQRLATLGYLPPKAVTGAWDVRTSHAVLAFQAWEGLVRDGIVGPKTLAALEKASRPQPASTAGRRHVEVHRQKGVTLLVERGRVVRALHSSSGASRYTTPAGSFSIFRKELNSWSVPYRLWLPYASYFNGGIAFHGYSEVPAYPASHGCVRLPISEAPVAYAFMSVGTRVAVY